MSDDEAHIDFRIGWIGDLDRRTTLWRTLNGRLSALYADLGGYENLTTQQRVLAERCVFLEHTLKLMEAALLERQAAIDLGRYGFLANTLSGILKTLGLTNPRKPSGSNGMEAAWEKALATGPNATSSEALTLTDQTSNS